jgi:hypothetical protein
LTIEEIVKELQSIIENIDLVDWKNEFSAGISLLGGELYFIEDPRYQEKFMELIDVIIEKILLVNKDNPMCRYSTVTNGLYDPKFLYRVVDRIAEKASIQKVDVNFSYDLDFRFKNQDDAKRVLENVKAFSKRYNYQVGVQMILTQRVIDRIKTGEFDVNKFETEQLDGNLLAFLYPHTPRAGFELEGFYFKRSDFIWFLNYLKAHNSRLFYAFSKSTENSGTFKYTGLSVRVKKGDGNGTVSDQPPVLSEGKELINPRCGHSLLYRCYADSHRCILCDIKMMSE